MSPNLSNSNNLEIGLLDSCFSNKEGLRLVICKRLLDYPRMVPFMQDFDCLIFYNASQDRLVKGECRNGSDILQLYDKLVTPDEVDDLDEIKQSLAEAKEWAPRALIRAKKRIMPHPHAKIKPVTLEKQLVELRKYTQNCIYWECRKQTDLGLADNSFPDIM